MSFVKKISITLLILPLAGIVFASHWFNKLFGKSRNLFGISEAQADASCWVPPSCVGTAGTAGTTDTC